MPSRHQVVPFRHHVVHDIESVFWVFLWFLSHRLPESEQAFDSAEIRPVLENVFSVSEPSAKRSLIIFSNELESYKVQPEFQPLVQLLAMVAQVLRDIYKVTRNPDDGAAGTCFGVILAWVRAAQRKAATLPTTLLSRIHNNNDDKQESTTPDNKSGSKRSRDSRRRLARQAPGEDSNRVSSQSPSKRPRVGSIGSDT